MIGISISMADNLATTLKYIDIAADGGLVTTVNHNDIQTIVVSKFGKLSFAS